MVINRARTGAYPPISDYGVVGDCRSIALISAAGSIDWWCPDRFDAPSVFGALLDRRRGGRFRIRPFGLNWSAEQRYLPGTCVLESVFTTLDGRARLLDFAPIPSGGPGVLDPQDRGLVRIIEGISGTVTLEIGFDPRFGYGREVPDLSDLNDGVHAQSRSGWARLWCTGEQSFEGGRARVTIGAGEQMGLICQAGATGEPQIGSDPWVSLDETTAFWSRWASRNAYAGPYHAHVERSLLTLKLLTYVPTGVPVSCATTSLPRWIPGERTWDMRYPWLRDVARTAASFARAGYDSEAEAALDWLGDVVSGADGPVPGARDVGGNPVPAEWELDWLEGYEGCRPVRVGNEAANRLQLDVVGEIVIGADVFGGSLAETLADDILAAMAPVWREPDLGPWALRTHPRQYVQPRALLAGVARLVEQQAGTGSNGDLAALRRDVETWLSARGYQSGTDILSMLSDGIGLDAAALRLAALPSGVRGDRFAATVDAVAGRLSAQGFVMPYTPEHDGVAGARGASVPASFWLVEAQCTLGRHAEARSLFERLLTHAGPLGLLSEDADPYTSRSLGNYPSAAAHTALIDAAYALEA